MSWIRIRGHGEFTANTARYPSEQSLICKTFFILEATDMLEEIL